MLRIKTSIAEQILKNYQVLGRLVSAFDVHFRTVENWIKDRDIRLTTPTAMNILKEELKLTEEEIIEAEPVSVK